MQNYYNMKKGALKIGSLKKMESECDNTAEEKEIRIEIKCQRFCSVILAMIMFGVILRIGLYIYSFQYSFAYDKIK